MTHVKQAMEHAQNVHMNQKDLSGVEYIYHVQTVAEITALLTDDPETITIAWLHDVLEDTEETEDDLRIQGYPENVIQGVLQLTRKRGTPYKEYIHNITDPKAKTVKIADLLHNQDDTRLSPDKRNPIRKHKYHRAIYALTNNDKVLVKRLLKLYNKYSNENRRFNIGTTDS